jgi:hypothetical protein
MPTPPAIAILIAVIGILLTALLLYRKWHPRIADVIPPTWVTNWREMAALAILGGGTLLLNANLDYLGGWFGDPSKFAYLSNFLLGFAKWSGANFCGVLAVILWPSFNKFGNEKFGFVWRNLPNSQQMFLYVGFILAQVIAAALCFSGAQ